MANKKIRLAAIKALENERGRVTAEDLVDAARDRDHPLHEEFDWSDTEAANKWRVHQARQILSSVRVVHQIKDQRLTSVVYVRDPEAAAERRPGYVEVATLRTEPQNAREALAAEIAKAQALLERVKELAAALDLTEEFEQSLASAMTFVGRMRRGISLDEGGGGVPLQ
jgi:hypothetical protein